MAFVDHQRLDTDHAKTISCEFPRICGAKLGMDLGTTRFLEDDFREFLYGSLRWDGDVERISP